MPEAYGTPDSLSVATALVLPKTPTSSAAHMSWPKAASCHSTVASPEPDSVLGSGTAGTPAALDTVVGLRTSTPGRLRESAPWRSIAPVPIGGSSVRLRALHGPYVTAVRPFVADCVSSSRTARTRQ